MINVVADPGDAVDLVRHVAGLANPAAGRVVFHPTPGTTSPTDFAADVLTSLGKRFDALRFEKATKQAWTLVDTWVQAEEVRDLSVLRAGRVDPDLLRRLTGLASGHGATVWLIGGAYTTRPQDVREWNALEFKRHWASHVGEDGGLGEGAPFPEVPDDDFLTFRWSCRRLLDAGNFQLVDSAFSQSMQSTSEWLRPWTGYRRSGADERGPDGDEVATQLQALLVSASSPAEALARLRGAQAAYFRAGWLIEYPTGEGSPGFVPLGPSLDPTTARRLRRLCVPASTAAMALVLATDLRSSGLAVLNVSDIENDGRGVLIGGRHRFTVPSYARSLVRALLIERTAAGAGAADALFVDPRRGQRITTDRMRTILRKLCWSTAIAVGLLAEDRSPIRAEHWLSERRLAMIPIADLPSR